MGLMRFSELHCREVINLCDGARLGEVCDLVFDPVCGQITAIVVPGLPLNMLLTLTVLRT